MGVHFNDVRGPVHVWGDCAARISGELTRFDSRVHWSDRPVIDHFDMTSNKVCSICRAQYDAGMARHMAAVKALPRRDDRTFNHVSNAYLTKVSLYMWLFAALTYLTVNAFHV